MAFNYQQILDKVAIPQIDDKGDDVVLRSRREASGSDDWDPTFDETETTVRAVRTQFKAMEVDGKVIRKDDVLFLIAPQEGYPEPELVSQLVDGDLTYNVISVTTVRLGPLSLLWKVQCRK